MNKIYWYITSFFTVIIVITLAYYVNFQFTLDKNDVNQAKNGLQAGASDGTDAIAADGKLKATIGASTVLLEEYYNVTDATYSDNEVTIPKEYIGCTREQLIEKIKAYMKDLPQTEIDKGLISMNLISFSKDTIRIRKVYDDKNSYMYYLTEENGYIVVYENDKKTVVEETGISYHDLDESQKTEIDAGVYLSSDEELYCFLESYSS